MKILVTGGAGYIGSITNKYLRENGYETVIFDNLSTGYKSNAGDTQFYQGDLLDFKQINRVFDENNFDGVIHFAAKALAGESMAMPDEYFKTNILAGINLLEAMRTHNCLKIVFSSTCAVYGYPETLPVTENETYKPVSVYGASKRMFEQVLEWYQTIYGIHHGILRYFNACGAYHDGSLGENHPNETHIIPIAMDVALGIRSHFNLFGDDYKTKDGTCVRDYIHVEDLANAHKKAVELLQSKQESFKVNLGVGTGYSNLEILHAVEKVSGKKIPVVINMRREGDPDAIYSDNSLARTLLHWIPQYTDLIEIIESAWKWHLQLKK